MQGLRMAADIHIIVNPHTYLFDTYFTPTRRQLLSSGRFDLFTRLFKKF